MSTPASPRRPRGLDIRQLRFVIEIADRGNFSRAAERLGIAQPALSQQVLKVERELGFDLFHRHPRGASLTPAGEPFVTDARAAVSAFDEAMDRAGRRASGQTGRLTVGFVTGAVFGLAPRILQAFGERYPEVEIRLRETDFSDLSGGLGDGEADVAFVLPPLTVPGLWHDVLTEEPRTIALSQDHPLADRSEVSVREILDQPLIGAAGADQGWADHWLLKDYRAGQPAPVAAWVRTCAAELQLVAAGRAAAVTSGGLAEGYRHLGVAFVPIVDVSFTQVVVAYRAGTAEPLVQNFVRVATEVRDAQHDTAPGRQARDVLTSARA